MPANSMQMINAYNPDASDALSPEEKQLVSRRERLLGPAYRLFYEHPVHIVRGEGVWLYDPQGNAYLDVYNNVACVGHSHPHVVQALSRQAAMLNTHTRYLHETVLDYAEKLLQTFPPELRHVMFTCTGSEANDLAIRVARHFTGGTGVIVTALAYHGVTASIAELSPSLGANVPLGASIRAVPAPDPRGSLEAVTETFAADLQAAIADMQLHGIKPAALLVDTIFASDGIRSHPPGFLRKAAEIIRAAGGVFIADEVQPGFGRTGDAMWGFQRHGVVPDIVTVGKPMGNGHPVAGMIARPEVLQDFGRKTRYFNTFGGNPVSAAVGLAVLEVIEREDLISNAATVGACLQEGLLALGRRYDLIAQVRGAGLFVGLDLARDGLPATAETARIVNGLRERRILISASGLGANVLKIRPPLPFSTENAATFLTALDEVLAQVS
jgi:4-aminobutyrate aminotransferase-like enzyme